MGFIQLKRGIPVVIKGYFMPIGGGYMTFFAFSLTVGSELSAMNIGVAVGAQSGGADVSSDPFLRDLPVAKHARHGGVPPRQRIRGVV